MKQRFANNFKTTVAATFGVADPYLQLTSTAGLPTLGENEYFKLTLFRQTGVEESGHEVIKVTAITGNQCTVSERSVEGADATTFNIGDFVACRVTALALEDVLDVDELAAALVPYVTQTALTTALTLKANVADVYAKTETFTQVEVNSAITVAINALIGSAPANLNTLVEIAAAIGNDPAFQTTVTTALAGKEALLPADGTTAKYLRGDKTWQVLNNIAVGLGNVENKSSATIRSELTAANVNTALGTTVVQNRPKSSPSLLLAFSHTPGVFDPRLVITRASAGGRFSARGLYEVVAANQPRFDYDPVTGSCLGLLIEEQRTQTLTYSERFDNPAWTKARCTIVPNAAVAPDGSRTASKLVEDTTASNSHLVYQVRTGSNETVTATVFAKAGERTRIKIEQSNFATASCGAIFDLSAGTVVFTDAANADYTSPSSSITNVGNGWYRCALTVTKGGVNTTNNFTVTLVTGTIGNYTGDGVSGLYVWGAQLEAGAIATSYISSTTTFTSRTSGNASYIGSNGLLQYAGSNVGRIQYNALDLTAPGKLLLEAAGTNLLTYSERFDNAAWGKTDSSITGVLFTAPDGSLSASKLTENTATLPHFVASPTVTVAAGTYTSSVYVKAGERTKCVIHHRDSAAANYAAATFDLVAGTVSAAATVVGTGLSAASARIEYLNNGWYRCSVTATLDGSFTGLRLWVRLHNDTNDTYTGNGTSGLYIWGAQVEAGAYATSYTPSTDTFTSRASAGSYNGSNGLVQSAASNVARMQYNPLNLAAPAKLLLEAAATNLLLRSEEFDNAAWVKTNTTVTANSTVAPDGVTSMDMLDGTVGSAVAAQSASIPAGTTTPYTASIFLKQGTAAQTSLDMVFFTGGTANTAKVTITWATTSIATSGTASGISARMMSLGNGIYRFEVTGANSGGNNSALQFAFYPSHIGTGTVYAWGAQLEAGSFATSYIATTSAQVTRAADVSSSAQTTRAADVSSSAQTTRSADVVSMPTSAAWFNQNEGTLYVEAGTNGLGTSNKYPWLSRLDDGSNNNSIGVFINDPASDMISVMVKEGNVSQFSIPSSSVATAGASIKAALGYKTNDSAFSVNGGSVITDTECRIPVVNRLLIGGGDYPLNGFVKRIAYYPRRLSNAELQGLTQ